AGLTALARGDCADALDQIGPARIVRVGAAVDAFHRRRIGAVAAEDVLHGGRDLTERRPLARAFHGEAEQILLAAGTLAQRIERGLAGRLVALGLHFLDAPDLRLAHGVVVDIEDLDLGFLGETVFVDADDHLLTAVDP